MGYGLGSTLGASRAKPSASLRSGARSAERAMGSEQGAACVDGACDVMIVGVASRGVDMMGCT